MTALALCMGGADPLTAGECAEGRGKSVAGLASWYGPGFHGRRTANGSIYDQMALTAASVTLPLGTLVEVRELREGRMVVLTVTDRGPYVGGRLIDVSRGAARRLGIEERGVAPVMVTPIGCDPEHAGYRRR